MRYRLRTLLIALLILPPILGWGYLRWERERARQKFMQAIQHLDLQLNFGGVIPRIIIQEEEEIKLGIEVPEE